MVFISHKSDPDHGLALEIASRLRAEGVECWIAPDSIPSGTDYAEEIPWAINTCEVFIIIFSSQSQKSPHVRKELDFAIDHRKKIIPLKIGEFDVQEKYMYLLKDVQVTPFNSTDEEFSALAEICRLGERLVRMDIGVNPKRTLSIIKGGFTDNMQYMLENAPNEIANTVFAVGMDRTARLELSSSGILKALCGYFDEAFGIPIGELQKLVDEARVSQLGSLDLKVPMKYKESILIEVPVSCPQPGVSPVFKLLLIANSGKKDDFKVSMNIEDIVGIDSREVIMEVFEACKRLGEKASTLFIGAMGTKNLEFPYEVVTAEIINCFAFSQRRGSYPLNLYFSIREEDMKRSNLTLDKLTSYISSSVHFYNQ